MELRKAQSAIAMKTTFKDGLRTLRFNLRQSRALIKRSGADLPLADQVDRVALRADRSATRLGRASARLARQVLFGSDGSAPWLPSPFACWSGHDGKIDPALAPDFARAAYQALGTMLDNLGADHWLIREKPLQSAFLMIDGSDDPARAASLARAMIEHRPVAEVAIDPPRTDASINQICAFGLAMAMATPWDEQADDPRTNETSTELLDASAHMVQAVLDELNDAEPSDLPALIQQYAKSL